MSSYPLAITMTRSQQMALINILVAYIQLTDQPQEFHDVANDKITQTSDLLSLVSGGQFSLTEEGPVRRAQSERTDDLPTL